MANKLPILNIKDQSGNWIPVPAIQGPKGDAGSAGPKGDPGVSGVALQEQAPVDEQINVWINPNSGQGLILGSNILFADGDTYQEKFDKGEFKGDQGEQGIAGNTPVKGVDYNTEADKNEMVQKVLESLPNYLKFYF